MLVGLNPERCTFRESTEQTKLQTVAYVDDWMHQAGHESTKHLRLSGSIRFRSVIEVGAFRIEIVLERLVDSLGDQLIGEEFEVRLVVLHVTEVVGKVVVRDRYRGLSNRTLVTRIVLVCLTEEFPVRPHSVNGKHMMGDMTVGGGVNVDDRNHFCRNAATRTTHLWYLCSLKKMWLF